MKTDALVAGALALSLMVGPAAAKDRTETVTFKPGATSTTLDGRITGYDDQQAVGFLHRHQLKPPLKSQQIPRRYRPPHQAIALNPQSPGA